MKRILSVLMILTIIVSMTACADSKINEPDIIEHDAPLSSSSENISDTENEMLLMKAANLRRAKMTQ